MATLGIGPLLDSALRLARWARGVAMVRVLWLEAALEEQEQETHMVPGFVDRKDSG